MSLTSVATGVITDHSAGGAESFPKTFNSLDASDGIASGGQI